MAKSESRKTAQPKTPKTPRSTPASRAKGKLEAGTAVADLPDQQPEPAGHKVEPTDEEVRVRAYFRYLERGGSPGGSIDDWAEAKKDLVSAKKKQDT